MRAPAGCSLTDTTLPVTRPIARTRRAFLASYLASCAQTATMSTPPPPAGTCACCERRRDHTHPPLYIRPDVAWYESILDKDTHERVEAWWRQRVADVPGREVHGESVGGVTLRHRPRTNGQHFRSSNADTSPVLKIRGRNQPVANGTHAPHRGVQRLTTQQHVGWAGSPAQDAAGAGARGRSGGCPRRRSRESAPPAARRCARSRGSTSEAAGMPGWREP
jgi:hypothetical protein